VLPGAQCSVQLRKDAINQAGFAFFNKPTTPILSEHIAGAPSVATDTSFSHFSFDLSIQTGKKGGRPTFWRQRWSLSAPACGSAKLNAREKNSNLSELLKQKML